MYVHRFTLTLLAGCLLFAGPVRADEESGEAAKLIEQLASDDFAKRQQAGSRLAEIRRR